MPLTCTYSQTERSFICTNERDEVVVNAQAYSGTGVGRNNPAHNGTRDIGPTPRGTWNIGEAGNNAHTGPNTIQITHAGGEPFPPGRDRNTFLIHGNNARNDASQGCVILGATQRQAIINGGGGTFTVTN